MVDKKHINSYINQAGEPTVSNPLERVVSSEIHKHLQRGYVGSDNTWGFIECTGRYSIDISKKDLLDLLVVTQFYQDEHRSHSEDSPARNIHLLATALIGG